MSAFVIADEVIGPLQQGAMAAGNKLYADMNTPDLANSPQGMLQIQMDMQVFTLLMSASSAILSDLKDTEKSIISHY